MKPIDMRNAIANQCGFKYSKANEHDCDKCGEHFSTCICPDWPTIEEQEQYWKVRDKDLDRIESQAQWIDERDKDLEHESRVDYEQDQLAGNPPEYNE